MGQAARKHLSSHTIVTSGRAQRLCCRGVLPRLPPLIRAILQAAEATRSPVIVQIAQIELKWYQLSLNEFARQFWLLFNQLQPTVPVGLHLDHSSDFALIQAAVANGFTSVMVDASALPLEKNIAETRRVVEFAMRTASRWRPN